MKTILFHSLLFVCLLVTPLVGGVTEDKIQGQWAFKFIESGFNKSSSTSFLPKGEFRENGTIAITMNGREEKPEVPYRIRGKWELDDETVVITVSHSTARHFIEVGSVIKINLHKVTDMEMLYEATPERIIRRSPRIGSP